VFHDKLKHIKIRYHYIKDMVQKGAVRLQYVATDEQVVNVMTNSIVKDEVRVLQDKIDVVPLQRE
jgi:hypothetical protein